MDNLDFNKIIWMMISIILTTIITWAAKKLTSLIDNKIDDVNSKKMLNNVVDLITNIVKEISQTIVSNLKSEGDFSQEKQKEVLLLAMNRIKKMMTAEAKQYIINNYNDLDEWLKTIIESVLYDLKN